MSGFSFLILRMTLSEFSLVNIIYESTKLGKKKKQDKNFVENIKSHVLKLHVPTWVFSTIH